VFLRADSFTNLSDAPKLGDAYRFETRLIARGYEMEKGNEQAFLLASKLLEGVNGRYSINLKDVWNVGLQAMCATPHDANSRLSKKDCPQVVDPALHRRYPSITGCLSYLV
jgi:hypothetical protein